MKANTLNKSEKILIAIYELDKEKKDKITVEDVAVKLWKIWPSEFCMRGYPKFPNNDIQKYITKILDNNFVKGGVFGYKITGKGITYAEQLKGVKIKEKDNKIRRQIESEYDRIARSKVFKYYSQDTKMDFLESDLFEFLGTSPRSLSTKDRNIFLTRYNSVVKDVIPFCKKIADKDKEAKKIIEIWEKLSDKFEELLNQKFGVKK